MSLEAQTYLLLSATLVLYFALPAWLFIKGWIMRAGLAALLIAFLPSFWQGVFWEDSAGSFGLLLFVLVLLPLIFIVLGLASAIIRAVKRFELRWNYGDSLLNAPNSDLYSPQFPVRFPHSPDRFDLGLERAPVIVFGDPRPDRLDLVDVELR